VISEPYINKQSIHAHNHPVKLRARINRSAPPTGQTDLRGKLHHKDKDRAADLTKGRDKLVTDPRELVLSKEDTDNQEQDSNQLATREDVRNIRPADQRDQPHIHPENLQQPQHRLLLRRKVNPRSSASPKSAMRNWEKRASIEKP